MKFSELTRIRTLLIATALTVSVSSCAVGFNKNGFYCTEGPVSDETPSCFRSTSAAKAPRSETTLKPEAAVKP